MKTLSCMALLLAATFAQGAVPKVPGVAKTKACEPTVVEIELPAGGVMGWAPGFAPEACFVDEMKPLRPNTARLLVLPKLPGVYRVVCWLKGETDYIVLIIDVGGTPPDAPKPPPDAKADPVAATGRIRFGTAGCTATVIGPRRADGRWDVLTAAHCVGRVGNRGELTLKDGRKFGVTSTVVEENADIAWLVTDSQPDEMPYAVIAAKNPAPGTAIWHMGYGVDKPGNREEGRTVSFADENNQLEMELSVSSGDSGSGIFRKDTGELVAVVCCTTGVGKFMRMWGGSAEAALAIRPNAKHTGVRVKPIGWASENH